MNIQLNINKSELTEGIFSELNAGDIFLDSEHNLCIKIQEDEGFDDVVWLASGDLGYLSNDDDVYIIKTGRISIRI